jgi:hypothetical protein
MEVAVPAAAEVFMVPDTAVRAGLGYYAAFPEEIDAWIVAAQEESIRTEQEWLRQQARLQ